MFIFVSSFLQMLSILLQLRSGNYIVWKLSLPPLLKFIVPVDCSGFQTNTLSARLLDQANRTMVRTNIFTMPNFVLSIANRIKKKILWANPQNILL